VFFRAIVKFDRSKHIAVIGHRDSGHLKFRRTFEQSILPQ
jgi:hypothetical protein